MERGRRGTRSSISIWTDSKEDEVALEEDECPAPEDEAVDCDFDNTEIDLSKPIPQTIAQLLKQSKPAQDSIWPGTR